MVQKELVVQGPDTKANSAKEKLVCHIVVRRLKSHKLKDRGTTAPLIRPQAMGLVVTLQHSLGKH